MPKGVYDRKTEEERFWEKVNIKTESECWLWLASVDKDGYGNFSFKSITAGKKCKSQSGKGIPAHRYSALLKYKDLGDKLVRHTCDIPNCVNPSHLILGTPADNSADMVERNRQACGEKNCQAILSDTQAKEVLIKYKAAVDSGKTYGILIKLAKEYSVDKQVIYRITSRQTYSHIVI